MKINFLFLLIFLIFNGCGYKVVTQTQKQNFQIVDIETTGDSRVNFYLKNKLNSRSENVNLLKINIEIFSKKKKTVKEKNINNEITKYQISIRIDVKVAFLGTNRDTEFTLLEIGNFDVGNIHSQTLTNEKKITKLLTENITKKLISELKLLVNDS